MSKRLKLDALSKISRGRRQNKNTPVSTDLEDTDRSKFFEYEKDTCIQDVQANILKKNDKNAKVKSNTKKQVPQVKDETNCDQQKSDQNNATTVDGILPTWQPLNWEKQLDNIREMRKNHTAPVDNMGCHKCADDEASGPIFRFQALLALMLSSQTKDQVTHAAMQRLREATCTPQSILSFSDEELGKLIYPVSFYKRKAQYLKNTSKILLENYNGDIPNNVKELCSLPGVGPKMAHICMQVAWDEVTGIGVDTHVHRISNRLQWVRKPTKTPEDTRIALESWLPKHLWNEINHLLVGFGQEICQPTRPKCSECSNKSLCPFTGNKYQF